MTTIRSYRVKPRPGGSFSIEVPGAALFVRSGGWPGMRLFFDEQSEQYEGERSVPVESCAWHVRPFKRATFKFPAVVGPSDLVVEVTDCGVLALSPSEGCAPRTRYRYVANLAAVDVAEGATVELASFVPSSAEWNPGTGAEFEGDDSYLGGYARATRASGTGGLTLLLSAVGRLTDGTPFDVPIMQYVAAASAFASGDYVVSLELGGTRTFASGLTQGLTPLPRPGWRLDAVAAAGTVFSGLTGTIYARSLS